MFVVTIAKCMVHVLMSQKEMEYVMSRDPDVAQKIVFLVTIEGHVRGPAAGVHA